MTPGNYRQSHVIIQKLASSAAGSWLLAHVLRDLDRFVVWVSAGKTSLTSVLAGVPVIMITTTGAKSGLPRTSPLLPVRDPTEEHRFALIASNWGQHKFPSWYFNLKKNERAGVAVDGRVETYIAREATGDEYDRFWGYAVEAYFGYTLYKERAGRRIPIMVMEKE